MLNPNNIWVYFCFAAIIFTGIRGYQRKRTAVTIKNHQHLHLISTITTTAICAVVIGFKQPDIPSSYYYFFILCLINGLGYALSGVCNYGAVQHLKLATFQSVSKLSAFFPVIVFYFVLGEKISNLQLIGILLAAFPIMMLAYIEPEEHADINSKRNIKKGISFLLLYLLITSAMQIINVLVIKDDVEYSIGVDPFLFIMCTNVLSLPYIMFMIFKAKERFSITGKLYKAGISSGVINALAFSMFLLALSYGPASTVVPLYAYNAFISIALLKAFPISAGKSLTRKALAILAFIVLWSAISAWLLIKGSV